MIIFKDQPNEIYIDDKIILFAIQMQKELDENHKTKPDFFCNFIYNCNFKDWLYEFEYHKAKLIAAIMAKDEKQIIEYTADLGNYLCGVLFKTFDIQRSYTLCDSEKTKII